MHTSIDDVVHFQITYTTNKILCRLRDEGAVETYIELRPPSVAATILSVRDKVIRELLETERKYVQDLETLQVKNIKINIIKLKFSLFY